MKAPVPASLFFLVLLATALVAGAQEWATFTDTNRHFQLEYPSSWKINTETIPVMHYRLVFLSLNNFGKEHFTLREQPASTNTLEFGPRAVTSQLPPGAVYLDIGWWEGPWPRYGPGIEEMRSDYLQALLKTSHEEEADGLVTRHLEFHKWGRRWSIAVYMRAPVSQGDRQAMEKILERFHFTDIPAGDPVWAIGEARKHLPPEADPDQFTREGGSSIYYVTTTNENQDVIVTFTKHEPDQPKQTWSFRVLASGEVRFPLDDSLTRVKAAVSNLASRLPDLALIGVTEYENEVIAYYTVGPGARAGYGVGRADVTVRIDSYTSEPEAKRQLRQSEATRPVLPRIIETYQGSPVFAWAGGSVLGRVGTHVINLSSLKGSSIPAMTNMFEGLAEELKKP